jgi:N-methylhydantoinase A
LTVEIGPQELQRDGLRKIAERFDQEHKRLFTFALPLEHEIVTLRAAVQGRSVTVERPSIPRGGASPRDALIGEEPVYMDGAHLDAAVYERSSLKAGNELHGPAIVLEMDSTTVILPRHRGTVDRLGNILIHPEDHIAAGTKTVTGG